MIKRYATAVGAGLTGIALLASCGSGGSSGTPSVEATSPATSPSSEAANERTAPDQVIVHRPGFIDTYLTADDAPAWPGPAPEEFLEPRPPSGMSGTLTGPQAQVAYEAALEHPDALIEEGEDPDEATAAFWGFEGIVLWLVVEPQW